MSAGDDPATAANFFAASRSFLADAYFFVCFE
jgi:hypothetical protein